MPRYDCRAYADTTVGIFVGIYETLSLDWHIQPRDMNSVGDQTSFEALQRFTREPRQAWLCGFFCCTLPHSTASTNNPLPRGVLGVATIQPPIATRFPT